MSRPPLLCQEGSGVRSREEGEKIGGNALSNRPGKGREYSGAAKYGGHMQALFLISLLLFQVPVAQKAIGISGRVTFSDGAPAPGTVMRAVHVMDGVQTDAPARGYLTATDATGRYGFELVPGRYYVRAEETGNLFTYYPGVTTETDAMPVTALDTPLENLNIALPLSSSGVHVIGRVKFPAGQQRPSPNQTVQLNGSYRLNGPIAADGTFDIPHVRRG